MYIGHENSKQSENQGKINNFFQKKEPVKEPPRIEAPEEKLIEENSRDVLMHWQAPEFESFRKDERWYKYLGLVLAAIVGYAIYTNGLIMAITFILIGIVFYLSLYKEPRILNFLITEDGIIAGREIYEFENIKSFWIFYEPGDMKVISLHIKGALIPFVHIPVHEQDPVEIREVLIKLIPEVKQETSMIDWLERFLGI